MIAKWLVVAAICAPTLVCAQTLRLQVEGRDRIYAELPFVLTLSASGFEEEPVPDPPSLTIAGASVTWLGVTPSVSQRIQIVNGERSEWREVTFVYRWRIEAATPGDYSVPELALEQNGTRAVSEPARFTAHEISDTEDMLVRMQMPERVWAGETFDATVEWLLRRDVGRYEFVVPLFNLEAAEVTAPPNNSRRTLEFSAGQQEVALPIEQDRLTESGIEYSRFRFPARVTITRAGTFELPPVRVGAALETGTGRDSFGFARSVRQLYKAQGRARSLEVKPLPLTGRPASFTNAIGEGLTIEVQASRSVVRVGDPIELTIRVRGDAALDGLSLPSLTGSGGLPASHFSVTTTDPVGVVDSTRNEKVFDVTVRVDNDAVSEIPPLELSWFDPSKGQYQTTYSQPIALSVSRGETVGVDDVAASSTAVAASATVLATGKSAQSQADAPLASLVGADMSLSDSSDTLRPARSADDVMPLLWVLYVAPLLLGAGVFWWTTTGTQRTQRRALAQAHRRLELALESEQPAAELAPVIVNELRALARLLDRHDLLRAPVITELETRAYDPQAAGGALDLQTKQKIRQLLSERAFSSTAATVTALFASALLIAAIAIESTWANETQLVQARATYQDALAQTDRTRRAHLFAQAELQFSELAKRFPHAAELQTDWGNAALGAQLPGTAVLAFRRALLAEPALTRAKDNLRWIRERQPQWLPAAGRPTAIDSLAFWHTDTSVANRHLLGAVAFGLAVLFLAPWPIARRAGLRRLSIPCLLIWLAAAGSALLANDGSNQAVVTSDGGLLRSADSIGAQPALSNSLPAGTEVTLVERRDTWWRIELADGTRGWLSARFITPLRIDS